MILVNQMRHKNAFRIFIKRLSLFSFFVAVFSLFFIVFYDNNLAFASEIIGTIDGTFKYAWGENIGWINFACDKCNVSVTDSGITGDAWSAQYGWINLNPNTSGVKNDGEGVLSGYAWSSNLGWISFNGVTINSNGDFLGYATIKSDSSRINFNCVNADSCSSANFRVKTEWRPASVRAGSGGGGGGGGGGGHFIFPPTTPPVNPPVLPPVNPPIVSPVITNPVVSVVNNISEAINSLYNSFLSFFKPQNKPATVIVKIPKLAPLSLNTKWNLLPMEAIQSFVFAPLPYEIRILASKFPELGNTFKSVGIERMTDMSKLVGTTFNLPGLAEALNTTINNIGVNNLTGINKLNGVTLGVPGFSNPNQNIITNLGIGNIALIQGLPLANFSLVEKKNLPAEFVFARISFISMLLRKQVVKNLFLSVAIQVETILSL